MKNIRNIYLKLIDDLAPKFHDGKLGGKIMLIIKKKIATLATGLFVTSAIVVGSISPVSAIESQPNLDDINRTETHCTMGSDSFTNWHAAAHFTLNDDGEKILTVTPRSEFRSHNRNSRNWSDENAVVDDEAIICLWKALGKLKISRSYLKRKLKRLLL